MNLPDNRRVILKTADKSDNEEYSLRTIIRTNYYAETATAPGQFPPLSTDKAVSTTE